MRQLPLLLMLSALLACGPSGDDDDATTASTPTPSSSPTATATPTPVPACDTGNGCDACINSTCAANACANALAACANDTDCAALSACFDACPPGDDTCVGNCMSTYSNGTQLYIDMLSCLLCEPTACSLDCAAEGASFCQ